MKKSHILLVSWLVFFFSITGAAQVHPRIYCSDAAKADFLKSVEQAEWKQRIIEGRKENLEKYLEYCESDPQWLVSRLQMNWKTKHDKVYLKGGKFSHSEGSAPVPTVRFSGSRDWATDYSSPSLEEVEPFFDDERGMFLTKKSTGEKEWVHPSETGHIVEGINSRIMDLVGDAAFLYWLTGEERYADFAIPVYTTYMEGMYHREAPVDLENTGQQRLSGLATFEVIHEGIVAPLTLTFDFLFNYFREQGYDLDMSVEVFQRWADQIIVNGVGTNNWNFFQARYLAYIALALDENNKYKNGKGQEYYLEQIFDITTERQIALKESILIYDQETGIWPESPSYSMHVTSTLQQILTLVDNVTNNNEFRNYPIVEKASLAAFQYLFPNGYTVGFGDSGHQTPESRNFELMIANYRKYNETEKEALLSGMLKNNLERAGNRGRGRTRGRGLFELFFYVGNLMETERLSNEELITKLTTPTFYAPNVSLFIQRMGKGDDAMMVSTVGSFGNHAHANGITMEIYANNYVLAPEMGRGPSYWHPDHNDYYAQLPAHNTVVVDGISTYESMRSYHPFTLDNHFPEHGSSNTTFDQVSFSKVSFVEPKTQSDQQRLTAIINSKSGNGYILDVFRSKKQIPEEQRHEYFYHGLGQSLEFFDEDDRTIELSPTGELGSDQGDLKAYDYFTRKQSFTSSEHMKAVFTLKSEGQPGNLMKMWIKGSTDQQVFSVKAPESRALSRGTAPSEMLGQEIPTLILRRNEEAWNNPFVVIFNPYLEGKNQVISNVSFDDPDSGNSAQLIKVQHSDGVTEDLVISNSSENDILERDECYFKGLFSIQRESDGGLEFLFASGATLYSRNGWEIISQDEPVTVSIERNARGFTIQNDGPVLVRVPVDLNPAYLELYEKGKAAGKRSGIQSRNRESQVEFRLEKPMDGAIIVMNQD